MNTALPSIPLVIVLAGCSASDGDADIETDAATSTGVAASTTSSTDPVDSSSSATTLTSGSSDDSSSTTANDSGEDASSTGPAATCDTIADVLPLVALPNLSVIEHREGVPTPSDELVSASNFKRAPSEDRFLETS